MEIRLEYRHVPGAVSATFGFAVLAGSRNETSGLEGLAHFVEHTIFKGTTKRSSWHINNRMESVGGELNAFTTKTDTVFYTVFPNGQLARAVELLADLAINASFPDRELDKERGVVAEEIDSYRDQPADAVFDDFEDKIYVGTPYGHNILGTRKTIAGFDHDVCRSWLERFFCNENMVFFYAGRQGEARVRQLINRFFTVDKPRVDKLVQSTSSSSTPNHLRDTHQAHTVMGCRLPKLLFRERLALSLLTNMLGGPGMNSLLNIELRERRGLVYSVESSVSYWPDCATFTVYYGCDSSDNILCHNLVNEMINRLACEPLSPRALKAAARQYKGQMLIATQNITDHVIARARARLLHGSALSTEEIASAIDTLTPENLLKAAERLTNLEVLSTSKFD